MQLLFTQQHSVYEYKNINSTKAEIKKLPRFNSDQSIDVPDCPFFFPNIPKQIMEKIYYYCFTASLKDRNFEAALFYATHVSQWLTMQIYKDWFSADYQEFLLEKMQGFGLAPTRVMVHAQIRFTKN